jgi:hypothetical protein
MKTKLGFDVVTVMIICMRMEGEGVFVGTALVIVYVKMGWEKVMLV